MTRDAIVGLVFFGALGLLGYFTIIVSDTSIAGLLGGKADKVHPYTIVFDSVAGLEKGMKVRASGWEVGEVVDANLMNDGQVEVRVECDRALPIRWGYEILIKDVSPLGGKYIDIIAGPGPGFVPKEEILRGTTRAGFLEAGGELVKDVRGDLKLALEEIRQTFANLREITDQVKTGNGTIGRLYADPKLYDELLATVQDIREFATKLNDPKGTIGQLLSSDELHTNINSAVKRIDDLIAGVQAGEGTAGKLFKDPALYDNLNAAVNELRAALTSGGTLDKLIHDPSLYDNLNAAVVDARAVIADVRNGKSSIGKLLSDNGELYDSLKVSLGNIETITGNLASGQGTLGKLINDDQIYNQLKKVLGELGKSIEDTREQAPINTFTSLIFSAF